MKKALSLLFVLFLNPGIKAQITSPFDRIAALFADYQYQEADHALQVLADSLQRDARYSKYDAQIGRALGDVERAREAYGRWLQIDSLSITAQMAWAQLEISQQNYDQAGRLYLALLKQDSLNPYFHKSLAYLELKRESPLGALAAFYRSLALDDANQEVAAQLIRLCMEIKNYPAADSLLAIYAVRHPNSRIFLQFDLASGFSQKDYSRVINRGEILMGALKDSSLLTLKRVGIAHYHQQQWLSSEALLQKALDLSDDKEQVYYYLGMLKAQQGLEAEAQAYLKQAIAAGTSESMPVYHLNLALSYDADGNYGAAITYYQKAWKATESPLILYYLARAYDGYYRDKEPAQVYYQAFLKKAGDRYYEYKDFSRKRLVELKRLQHFRGE